MRARRGMTLMEVIIVFAILALLSALITPVFIRAMGRGRETQAISNLRSIFVAADLYRTDHDGQGAYGYAKHMGLPSWREIYVPAPWEVLPGTKGLWKSPCGTHPDTKLVPNAGTDLDWFPNSETWDPQNPWPGYTERLGGNAVFLADCNCNDKSIHLNAPFRQHKHYGVALDGSIKTKIDSTGRTGFLVWNTRD